MAELFKFRCYQCQKLIGAPASKFGKVVKCPRCEVELIVPSPEGQVASPEPEDPDAIRAEDLGISLEVERLSPPRPSPPPVSVLEPVGPDPIAFLNRVKDSPETVDSTGQEPAEPEPAMDEPNELSVLPEPTLEPLVARARPRTGQARVEPTLRSRDVVFPRTAALAWSLFGLLGLAFAFIAGLLLGHFLWK